MKELNYIVVAGFGWSGSGAVVDLLKEYKGLKDPAVEFRLIKDPYCINDLYNAIVKKGDPLNVDTAIQDFVWYVKKLRYKASKWNLNVGLDYNSSFGEDFYDKTKAYIGALTDFYYDGHWWMYEFKENKIEFIVRKIRNHLKGLKKYEKLSFALPSEKKFYEETKKYIDGLFEQYVKDETWGIILDQGVSPQNYENELKCLGNAKIIIVDRDPRDIYTDLCVGGNLIGADCALTHDANKYVVWHQGHRRNCVKKNNENVLFIKFEDLILRYEDTVKVIEDFVGITDSDHVQKKQIFVPENSMKNIGIWKGYMNDDEIAVFDRCLSEYYYER